MGFGDLEVHQSSADYMNI